MLSFTATSSSKAQVGGATFQFASGLACITELSPPEETIAKRSFFAVCIQQDFDDDTQSPNHRIPSSLCTYSNGSTYSLSKGMTWR